MISELTSPPVDLELVAQRILKLAEIASLEHLEMLLDSQAQGVLEAINQAPAESA